jgi:Tol biopolymer transport system component
MRDDYNPACIISFMRRNLFIVYCLLVTVLFSCNSQTQQPSLQTTFYVYRFNPPAFVEFSNDFQMTKEIPFSIPINCGLLNTFPAPIGEYILIELNCPNGQTVLFLDTNTASTTQPITDSDSHFLAWTPDGKAAYLKADSLGDAHIVRVDAGGKNDFIPLTEFTYDLSTNPANDDFTFTFSRGLGQGSELWLATRAGKIVRQLYADPFNYISFARYSPDGNQIAFIKIPDTGPPFTVGELWVVNADGSKGRKLADADAGHGYAANWSPDGKKIAFVVRENSADERADQSSDSLISNIYIVNVESGALTQITHLANGRFETPFWSPDGNTLAFNAVINDRMETRIADVGRVGSSASNDPYRDPTGEIRSLIRESTCCPAWMRK